jgi:hypothetical protein
MWKCFHKIPFGPACDKDAALFDLNGVEENYPRFRCVEHAVEEDKKIENLNSSKEVPLPMPNWRPIKEYNPEGEV